MAGKASATALLVQTNDIWSYNGLTIQPYEALSQSGVSFDKITHSQFNTWDLSSYCFLYLVGSAEDTHNFDTYIDMNRVENYVDNGGLALIHYADWSGDYTDIGPGGVDGTHRATNTGNINPMFAGDPLFNNVTDASIDNWGSTAHGYLTHLPGNADILITDDLGNPIYARYHYGQGQVWITTMTLEWGNADHDLLFNEINLAANCCTPVPEPSTMLLLGVGFVGLLGYGRQQFVNCG